LIAATSFVAVTFSELFVMGTERARISLNKDMMIRMDEVMRIERKEGKKV